MLWKNFIIIGQCVQLLVHCFFAFVVVHCGNVGNMYKYVCDYAGILMPDTVSIYCAINGNKIVAWLTTWYVYVCSMAR